MGVWIWYRRYRVEFYEIIADVIGAKLSNNTERLWKMVKCEYCGSVIDANKYTNCPNCNAPIGIDIEEINRLKNKLNYAVLQMQMQEINMECLGRRDCRVCTDVTDK